MNITDPVIKSIEMLGFFSKNFIKLSYKGAIKSICQTWQCWCTDNGPDTLILANTL